MKKTQMYTDKVTNIEVVTVDQIRIKFKCGANHIMSNKNGLFKVGDIIGIDSHGNVWVLQLNN